MRSATAAAVQARVRNGTSLRMSWSEKEGTSGGVLQPRGRAAKLTRAALQQRRERALEHRDPPACGGSQARRGGPARQDRLLADELPAQQQADQQQKGAGVEHELVRP